MTAEHNPIIQRIQGHKGRIQGMLTPGLRRSSGDRKSGSLSSIFTGFGGGKLKRVAKEMRALNLEKLGTIQPKAHLKFAESIPKKFQEIRSLIHFSPKLTPENSIWSEIERTLPAGADPFESPAQPGELRRGSRIQPISMFPKPGQSLEEFKQQSHSIPKPKKRPITTPKPRLEPKAQLFSRVQEISQPDEPPPEIPEVEEPTEPPVDPDMVQPQLEEELIPEEVEPEVSPDESIDDVVVRPEPKSVLKKAQPVLAKPKLKPAAPELPQAKPSRRTPKRVERPPAKLQLRASQASEPSAPGVVQPKREASTPKVAPKPVSPPPTPAPIPKATDQPLPPPSEPIEESLPSLPKPQTQEPPELPPPEQMPLQKKIQAQQKASHSLKVLQPEAFTPVDSLPLVAPPSRPIVERSKYRPAPQAESVPQAPLQNLLPSSDAPPAPILPKGRSPEPQPPSPSPIEPLSMALAYPSSPSQPSPKIGQLPQALPHEMTLSTPQLLMGEQPLFPPEEDPDLGKFAISPFEEDGIDGEEIVTRQVDEFDDVEADDDVDEAMDLDQLAEDVLPLVKRILEIESERLSRNL
jgi:hypothetical protein